MRKPIWVVKTFIEVDGQDTYTSVYIDEELGAFSSFEKAMEGAKKMADRYGHDVEVIDNAVRCRSTYCFRECDYIFMPRCMEVH